MQCYDKQFLNSVFSQTCQVYVAIISSEQKWCHQDWHVSPPSLPSLSPISRFWNTVLSFVCFIKEWPCDLDLWSNPLLKCSESDTILVQTSAENFSEICRINLELVHVLTHVRMHARAENWHHFCMFLRIYLIPLWIKKIWRRKQSNIN